MQGCFFRMVAFAGERVLELEAPIRNDATKETLLGWGRTQDEVEGGRRRLEPAMVRECFEYLFSKVRGERKRRPVIRWGPRVGAKRSKPNRRKPNRSNASNFNPD